MATQGLRARAQRAPAELFFCGRQRLFVHENLFRTVLRTSLFLVQMTEGHHMWMFLAFCCGTVYEVKDLKTISHLTDAAFLSFLISSGILPFCAFYLFAVHLVTVSSGRTPGTCCQA